MPDPSTRLDDLHAALDTVGDAAVAVSGGVDSMTLAVVAHRRLGRNVTMFHAVSPAVPADATARVRRYSDDEGWALTVIDAGEINDARYVANPVNRCYFCKSNLYATMSAHTGRTLLSGTNLDDLGDFRPGLGAASEHDVRHPFVEASIDKAAVRAIARGLRLDDLAELPAAPCLSSRVETGIAIDPALLPVIDACEKFVREATGAAVVRCRVRRDCVAVELDPDAIEGLDTGARDVLRAEVATRFATVGVDARVRIEPYRMGSAFLRSAVHG